MGEKTDRVGSALKPMKVSIVVPVYHEEKNIKKVLATIEKKVKTPHETLIVYDYKQDPTYQLLQKVKKPRFVLVKNSCGNGRGVLNAIKTGFKKAQGEAVVVVMADLSDDVGQIDKMYRLIRQGYDIVCASRYMPGGRKIGGPLLKSWLSKLAGLTLHHLFGLPTRDATNAFKMYRRSVLKDIKIESSGGFEYSLEIVVKAFKKGYKITEIPTVWRDRQAGQSRFKLLKWLPKYLRWYWEALKP